MLINLGIRQYAFTESGIGTLLSGNEPLGRAEEFRVIYQHDFYW